MGVPLSAVLKRLEAFAPPGLAEPWDRAGLQVGDPQAPIEAVVVALDPSPRAVSYSLSARAQLLLTHHPLFLDPLPRLDLSSDPGRLLARCVREGLAVYCAHTNLDRAEGGVNDRLAEQLGLLDPEPLEAGEPQVKLVVTVPVGYESAVRRALAAVGAGRIGRYAGCSFGSRGWGRFEPLPGAKPLLGDVGAAEEVAETRLETVVPRSRVSEACAAVRTCHPYEEAALDLYPLENRSAGGALGRVGTLPRPATLAAFAADVAGRLGAPGVRFSGDAAARVERVAVCGGSGASLWPAALRAGAQVLVTGDVKHHAALDAASAGLAVIDAGHAATERAAVDCLVRALGGWADAADLRVQPYHEADPFSWWVPKTGG